MDASRIECKQTSSFQEMNRNRMRTKSQSRQRPEQGRPKGGLKMRPMRVKVCRCFFLQRFLIFTNTNSALLLYVGSKACEANKSPGGRESSLFRGDGKPDGTGRVDIVDILIVVIIIIITIIIINHHHHQSPSSQTFLLPFLKSTGLTRTTA